jgi:hypothetical protein
MTLPDRGSFLRGIWGGAAVVTAGFALIPDDAEVHVGIARLDEPAGRVRGRNMADQIARPSDCRFRELPR